MPVDFAEITRVFKHAQYFYDHNANAITSTVIPQKTYTRLALSHFEFYIMGMPSPLNTSLHHYNDSLFMLRALVDIVRRRRRYNICKSFKAIYDAEYIPLKVVLLFTFDSSRDAFVVSNVYTLPAHVCHATRDIIAAFESALNNPKTYISLDNKECLASRS